ncbi:MAG: sugar ABC transporter permease [Oscillospiraceae bacterium]|jgi:multiple sugar transport system permease protein|nr:sugar ABC transporter permease [Oscillospiraceae bacterium]
MAGFILIYVIPFGRTLHYTVVDDTWWERWVGLENFRTLFADPMFLRALRSTAVFSVVGVICLISFSLLLSVGLQKLGRRLAFIKSLLVAPIVLPTAAVVFVWQMLFQGPVMTEFEYLVGMKTAGNFFSVLPIYLLYIWKHTGLNIIILGAAIAAIPSEAREAAILDGAKGFRLFRSVTLPLISPVLTFVVMLSFSNSLKGFRESLLYYSPLSPPDALYTIPFYMDEYFQQFVFSRLTTSSVVFTFLIVLVLLVLYRWENRYNDRIY